MQRYNRTRCASSVRYRPASWATILCSTSLPCANPLRPYLEKIGEIFVAFLEQDSGNLCYGLRLRGERWFVKLGANPDSFEQVLPLARSVSHPALPALRHQFASSDGPVLVYPFVSGEVLNSPKFPGEAGRRRAGSAHARFRALAAIEIAAALDVIYDLHLAVAACGIVAVDFYDGSVLYDFERRQTHVIDLDAYRPGPFTLTSDRLPGSTRFMAPEELQCGARIDQVTNVYTLGRTALVLLGNGSRERSAWRGNEAAHAVALRATEPERERRYASVSGFVAAWRAAMHAVDSSEAVD